MKNKQKPAIRFKGFTDDWEQRKLGEVLISLQNNTLSRSELSYEYGKARDIHYGDILVKFDEVLDVKEKAEELPRIIDEIIINKYKTSFLQNGDIVIADTAEDETVGKCVEITGLSNEILISGLHTIPYRSLQKFAYGYLGYYMNSSSYHNQLLPLMQGIKVTSISKTSLKNTNILYPKSIKEQAVISKCFQELNHLITLHQCKVEKLKNIKKFMLENIFPKNGETVPKLRFKNFSDTWEQRKLGEFGKATGGTSIESEFDELGKYKVISIGSYSETSKYTDQGIRVNKTNKTESRILNKNDLTMILNDKTASGNIIGRVLLIDADDSYIFNQRTERIEVYKNEYLPEFLYQLLNADNIREKIIRASQGNTQIYVNWTLISELSYEIPLSKHEQRKIADLFNQLDHLITLHQCKVEKLKNIKKSLLEKMFV